MKIKKFGARWLLLFFIVTTVITIFFLTIAFFVANWKTEALFEGVNFIKFGIMYLATVGAVLFFMYYYFVYRNWMEVINEIKNGVKAVQSGNFDYRIKLSDKEEFDELEYIFNSLIEKLDESRKEIELQSLEIYAKTLELQQTNMELEASYGQLQATINQLNDSEQKYYSLVKNLTDIVCVIRLDGSIYFINDVVKNILGYSKEEVEGRNIKELLKPDISEGFFEKISKELRVKNTLTLELELVSKDGEIVLTETTLTNFIYDNEIIGIQAILRNITQKKKMEQEIIASNQELTIINEISKKLNSTLEINYLSDLVVQEIHKALKAPLCILRLLDESEEFYVPKAYAGEYLTNVISNINNDLSEYGMDNPLIEKITNSSEPVIYKDVNSSVLVKKINSEKAEKDKIKELLMVPLRIKGKNIGLITIGSIDGFSPRQIRLLTSITNNAAIAIENARLYDLSKKYFIRTVNALVAAIEAKDKYTQGHSYRVSKLAVMLAEKMGLTREQIDEIRVAGILHDIGKIGIPDAILNKPSKLTEEEFAQIRKHPLISNKILEPVGLPSKTMNAITWHHERWDGRGYPFGIMGDELSIEAQIISVADALDAMTSNRAYRKAMTEEEAIKEIVKCKDTQFSPKVVEVLLDLFRTKGIEMFMNDDNIEQ